MNTTIIDHCDVAAYRSWTDRRSARLPPRHPVVGVAVRAVPPGATPPSRRKLTPSEPPAATPPWTAPTICCSSTVPCGHVSWPRSTHSSSSSRDRMREAPSRPASLDLLAGQLPLGRCHAQLAWDPRCRDRSSPRLSPRHLCRGAPPLWTVPRARPQGRWSPPAPVTVDQAAEDALAAALAPAGTRAGRRGATMRYARRKRDPPMRAPWRAGPRPSSSRLCPPGRRARSPARTVGATTGGSCATAALAGAGAAHDVSCTARSR